MKQQTIHYTLGKEVLVAIGMIIIGILMLSSLIYQKPIQINLTDGVMLAIILFVLDNLPQKILTKKGV